MGGRGSKAPNDVVEMSSMSGALLPSLSNTMNNTVQSNSTCYRRRSIESVILVWFYPGFDESSSDNRDIIARLHRIVNTIAIFSDLDECFDFVSELNDAKVFMIISDASDKTLLPKIHDLCQLAVIYVISCDSDECEEIIERWPKAKSLSNDIVSLFRLLENDLKQYELDSMSISVVPLHSRECNRNLNEIEPSFIYSQILKEVIVEMEYNQQSINDFVEYWRSQYVDNSHQLEVIDDFECNYKSDSSIWWYTRTYFIYDVLNRTIHNLAAEAIIKMSFFMRDLHYQILQIHADQVNRYGTKTFVVYRGQGLAKETFKKLSNSIGGLISFNNFASMNMEKEVALKFAAGGLATPSHVGVIFTAEIDSSTYTTPFAFIENYSYCKTEREVLFSMHAVFRIGEIRKLAQHEELYEVELKLASISDKNFRELTEYIRQETKDAHGWERLVNLLIKLNQFDMAERLHNTLLSQVSDDNTKGKMYKKLGWIKTYQEKFEEALLYYDKALTSFKTNVPWNYSLLAATYNNIGSTYIYLAEYSKALLSYEKARVILNSTLPPDHIDFIEVYQNIGQVYDHLGEYSKALSFYLKAFEIQRKVLPEYHSALATSYNYIAVMYEHIGSFSMALSYYKEAIEVQHRCLPPDHPSLASSYVSVGRMLQKVKKYFEASMFYQKALHIYKKDLTSAHGQLAWCYNNIAYVYGCMGEFSKSLEYYQKALNVQLKTLPPNHPSLALGYYNMSIIHEKMGRESAAISYSVKAVEAAKLSLPSTCWSLKQYQKNLERLKIFEHN